MGIYELKHLIFVKWIADPLKPMYFYIIKLWEELKIPKSGKRPNCGGGPSQQGYKTKLLFRFI